MKDIVSVIKDSVKQGKVVLGFNKVINKLKTGNLDLVVTSDGIPKNKADRLMHNAKISKVNVEEYGKDSVNLGIICGKNYPISVLAIEGREK